MILLEQVSKHYRKGERVVRALQDVSLELQPGTLALVRGPSGSGKTTLINVAAGLTRPTSGAVTCAGTRLDGLSPGRRAALRAKDVAVVFQLFHLVPYLSAFENVLLPTLADPAASGGDAATRAQGLLTRLGIDQRADHYPDELSVGERQRCALARALLNRPKVVLADEPTGNLDEESARHVLQALHECRAEGATVLLVSHQHVAEIHADVTFQLADGVLKE